MGPLHAGGQRFIHRLPQRQCALDHRPQRYCPSSICKAGPPGARTMSISRPAPSAKAAGARRSERTNWQHMPPPAAWQSRPLHSLFRHDPPFAAPYAKPHAICIVASSGSTAKPCQLEDEIGNPLFERLRAQTRLTAAGSFSPLHAIAVLQGRAPPQPELELLRGRASRLRSAWLPWEGLNADLMPAVLTQMQALPDSDSCAPASSRWHRPIDSGAMRTWA